MHTKRNKPRLRKPRLKELRKACGQSRESIADMAGVDCATVESWERGSSPIPDELIAYFAERIGVSVAFLMRWEDVAPSTIPEQWRAHVAADEAMSTDDAMRAACTALLRVLERRLIIVDVGSSEHDRVQELRTMLLPLVAEEA